MSEIRVNTFKAEDGISAPSFPNGIQVTGVITATSLASSVPHLNVGDNIQLGAAGVTTATTFIGALTGNVNGNATGLSGTPNITVGSVVASTGTFSGNVSIGGTLTYEDVLNIDSVGIVTTRLGVFIPDDNTLKFGNTSASPDLKIEHVSSGTFNRLHASNGYMQHRASAHYFNNEDSSINFIRCENNRVDLRYNGSAKLTTETSGVNITGIATATSFVDSKGDLRKIIQNSQGSTYTLVASDSGKHILASGDVTIPNNVFATGDAVTIVNNTSGNLTLTASVSVLYNAADAATGNRTLATRGMATVLFGSATSAYISGAGLS